jgi:hypothetical protein
MNFTATMNAAKLFLRHHKSSILTGVGVVLTIAAVCETVRATSKAKDVIDELEYEKFEEMGAPEEPNVDFHLDKKEVLKGVWKCYIFTGLLTAGAVTCIICSHVNSNKTIGAMSMAYASLLETYNTYKDNVQRNLKEKDQQLIAHSIAHDIVEKDKQVMPEKMKEELFNNDGNDIKNLYRDAYSSNIVGTYFKKTSDEILRAENEFNAKLSRDGYASLNDWYDCLDLGHSEIGDYFGWRYDPHGPLFATTITDDYVVTRDKYNVICLGLSYSRYGKYVEKPREL